MHASPVAGPPKGTIAHHESNWSGPPCITRGGTLNGTHCPRNLVESVTAKTRILFPTVNELPTCRPPAHCRQTRKPLVPKKWSDVQSTADAYAFSATAGDWNFAPPIIIRCFTFGTLVKANPYRREYAFDVGLALGGKGRVGEDEVQSADYLLRPLPHHLRPHDRAAGAEAMEAQEPRPPMVGVDRGPEAPHRSDSLSLAPSRVTCLLAPLKQEERTKRP
ncbi:hypothetical protein BHE74_00047493 [Ensete ventricosum]|nr:hypothetical protein GW17_00008328 [Ensete ventricosum]RWW46570.1 hypothetical protein BHE74_00047493 [Ensete ventricosum]RZS20350.1 hypothetical protein BHM03_00052850 [Ensete ventricosum]